MRSLVRLQVFAAVLILSAGSGSAGSSSPVDSSETFDLYAVAADGNGRTRLSATPQSELSPAASARQPLVAYVRDGNVWVMRADGREQRALTSGMNADGPLAWSSDGRLIAFHVWDYTRCYPFGTNCAFTDVWVADVSAGGARKLLSEAVSPRWSPRGRVLAFRDFLPGINSSALWVSRVDGSAPRRLQPAVGRGDSPPDWSPTARWLVYEAGMPGRLFVLTAFSRRRRSIVSRGERPVWSPDGREIAFIRGAEVRVIAARGGRSRRLAKLPLQQGRSAESVAWSTDGSQLAVLSNGNLYSVRRSGKGFRELGRCVTFGALRAAPTWSRDSRRIYCAA